MSPGSLAGRVCSGCKLPSGGHGPPGSALSLGLKPEVGDNPTEDLTLWETVQSRRETEKISGAHLGQFELKDPREAANPFIFPAEQEVKENEIRVPTLALKQSPAVAQPHHLGKEKSPQARFQENIRKT